MAGLIWRARNDRRDAAFWYAHERAAHGDDSADEAHIKSIVKRVVRGHGMPLSQEPAVVAAATR